MKPLLCLLVAGLLASEARAASTIDPANRYSHGANPGWMDWRGDFSNGAVIGEYVCSGFIHAANVGWIHLGGGSPADGIRYRNDSATDYGVNQDGLGNLRGYAYGANIGWIAFEDTGAPRVDLLTGKLAGYAYSANCGWISLSNTFVCVQTDFIPPGADTDNDGIADAWEFLWFGSLRVASATSDYDGDGSTDRQEALADTNPLDPNDNLRLTSIVHGNPTRTYTVLNWTSKPTRLYAVQKRPSLDPGSTWTDFLVLPFLGANNVGFDESGDQDFYRLRAFRPLAP